VHNTGALCALSWIATPAGSSRQATDREQTLYCWSKGQPAVASQTAPSTPSVRALPPILQTHTHTHAPARAQSASLNRRYRDGVAFAAPLRGKSAFMGADADGGAGGDAAARRVEVAEGAGEAAHAMERSQGASVRPHLTVSRSSERDRHDGGGRARSRSRSRGRDGHSRRGERERERSRSRSRRGHRKHRDRSPRRRRRSRSRDSRSDGSRGRYVRKSCCCCDSSLEVCGLSD